MNAKDILKKIDNIHENSDKNKINNLNCKFDKDVYELVGFSNNKIINGIVLGIRSRFIKEIKLSLGNFIINQTEIQKKIIKDLQKKDELIKNIEDKLDLKSKEIKKLKKIINNSDSKKNVYSQNNIKNINEFYGIPKNIFSYKDFEDVFRGCETDIKSRLKKYLKFVIPKEKVVDLGCGRGEFLELLKEKRIESVGIDSNKDMINTCKKKNLNVYHGDIFNQLNRFKDDSLGTITAFQVIEHLNFRDIARLINICYKKLKKQGVLIFETPNPNNLSIFYNSFYKDPSHIKPISHSVLEFLFEKNGFNKHKILFSSKVDNCLEGNDENTKKLNKILFGNQDYALIGNKEK